MNSLAELKDQKILILGFGVEGLSTFKFLRKHFPDKILAVADQLELAKLSPEARKIISSDQKLNPFLGEGYLKSIPQYELIFRSPGISPFRPELAEAWKQGRLTSNTNLFFSLCQGTTIGVTGTKGKSTTTSLIAQILAASGHHVCLTGNIGNPPLDSLGGEQENTFFVIELSSHQLLDLEKSPQVAVFLNLYREHLDYYPSFKAYCQAKEAIISHQTPADWVVYHCLDQLVSKLVSQTKARRIAFGFQLKEEPGCFLEKETLVYASTGQKEKIIAIDKVPLLGRFNLLNVMAAIGVGKIFGLTPAAIKESIRHFQPLEHRLENLGYYRGVWFINDSIATIPEATIAALETFVDQRVILLVGGFDRGQDFSKLARVILQTNLKKLILLPETGRRIWREVTRQAELKKDLPGSVFVTSLKEAVLEANRVAEKGDLVLLSPAGASFNMFVNYQDRGNQFKEAVKEIGRG